MFSPKPVRVFFSHKRSDRDICITIREELIKEFGDDVEIFLSSEAECLPYSKIWQDEVEDNIREASWMFFFSLNPRQIWDWCFYEAGYFLGTETRANQRRLVVLHPEGVPKPAPLARIQSGAEATGVEQALRDMLIRTRSGRLKTAADWKRIAKFISDEIQAGAIQYFDGRYQLTAECPIVFNESKPSEAAVDHTKAIIHLNPESRALIGLGVVKGITWERFGNRLNQIVESTKDWRRAFDFYILEKAAISVHRDNHLGEAELQSFRIANDGYRPIITGADLEDDGTVHLMLHLVKIPDSLDAKSTNSFDVIYQSLTLGCQVRREFIERNQDALKGLKSGNDEAKELLTNLWRSLESVVNKSIDRGLTPERAIAAFDHETRLELDSLTRKWENAYFDLKQAVSRVDVEEAKALFTVIRHINLRYLNLAVARLNQLLTQVNLPGTDDLPGNATVLLPGPAPKPAPSAATLEFPQTETPPKKTPPKKAAAKKRPAKTPPARKKAPKRTPSKKAAPKKASGVKKPKKPKK